MRGKPITISSDDDSSTEQEEEEFFSTLRQDEHGDTTFCDCHVDTTPLFRSSLYEELANEDMGGECFGSYPDDITSHDDFAFGSVLPLHRDSNLPSIRIRLSSGQIITSRVSDCAALKQLSRETSGWMRSAAKEEERMRKSFIERYINKDAYTEDEFAEHNAYEQLVSDIMADSALE